MDLKYVLESTIWQMEDKVLHISFANYIMKSTLIAESRLLAIKCKLPFSCILVIFISIILL